MKISIIERYAPHILKLAKENLSKINFGSHPIDEEIESAGIKFLIAYAYRERFGISIPDCIVLLADYEKLQIAERLDNDKHEQGE